MLKPFQSFGRNRALDLWTVGKAESEKLPLLRSRHRALRFIHLEFGLLRDESRDAFHHPLTPALAANVEVAVVRVANIAMSSALQLTVEFVEHEVGQQRGKWTPLWSAFHAWADQSVLHHPSIQECPDEFQQPLVLDSFCDLTHQFVVIDSIEEFLQIEINHPAVARGNLLLCLGHCLMRGSARSKTVAVVGERRVPLPLQNLHHRLLDPTIQHCWDTKLSHPSVRFGDFHPPHRFRLVGPTQQLFSDRWPVLADGHSIDARATFISLHLLQSLLQVFSLTYFLHQSARAGWAFGAMPRRGRFGLFPFRFAGFTRWRRREVQFSLDVLPLVAPEIHVLLASPSRSGLRPPFPARPICFSTFRIGVPH